MLFLADKVRLVAVLHKVAYYSSIKNQRFLIARISKDLFAALLQTKLERPNRKEALRQL